MKETIIEYCLKGISGLMHQWRNRHLSDYYLDYLCDDVYLRTCGRIAFMDGMQNNWGKLGYGIIDTIIDELNKSNLDYKLEQQMQSDGSIAPGAYTLTLSNSVWDITLLDGTIYTVSLHIKDDNAIYTDGGNNLWCRDTVEYLRMMNEQMPFIRSRILDSYLQVSKYFKIAGILEAEFIDIVHKRYGNTIDVRFKEKCVILKKDGKSIRIGYEDLRKDLQ